MSLKRQFSYFFFLEASFIHVCLQHEANIDVQLCDGTLCLLQQMALIHIN